MPESRDQEIAESRDQEMPESRDQEIAESIDQEIAESTQTKSSLAGHTLQSQGKEGLVTLRTASCSSARILARPIRCEVLTSLLSYSTHVHFLL